MAGGDQQHTAVFAKMVARSLIEQGYDQHTVFRGTAFDDTLMQLESPIATAQDVMSFFEQGALLTNDDLFGFQLAQGQDSRRVGLVCYVGLAAPNVAAFLANYARYSRIYSDVLELDFSHLPDNGVVGWQFSISPGVERRQYVEYTSTIFLNTLRHFSGSDIVPVQVSFEHLRRQNVDKLEAYYGCKISFGAVRNSFEFRAEDLALPLISSDHQLLKVLQNYGDQVLAEKSRELPGLVFEVERVIADLLARGAATLDNVAIEMGMSPRTLSRKLAAEGTSFFRVLEDLRKSLSKSYLRDSDLVLAEIAFLLGYSGLSSFNEAFKRWTGSSPGQYRTV
ncbi:AraC family transcriptional regulator [Parasedimentitalea marina]|uniref:AraC family transcriptional regulator n=1 Tax=Parasedimentitalea marina TaxID=2483033 RepID=A0A3T0N5D5_9RHOB|nr:AraC family transcriptional regulator [Parasedimentitalea marina]AZV79238.1 AraC family transcriptional regulator [Parasedimentitalea marina]